MAARSGSCCSPVPTASSTSSRRSATSAARPSCCGTATRPSGPSMRSCVPGGFAHGDYLRPGAIARFSPIMEAVRDFAAAGGPVVGICNGFQVLTEAGLLPGALQKNRGLKFLCTTVALRVETGRLGAHLRGGVPVTCSASRSTTSRATTPATLTRWPCSAPRTGSWSATSTTPTARSTTSRACATRAATWSG